MGKRGVDGVEGSGWSKGSGWGRGERMGKMGVDGEEGSGSGKKFVQLPIHIINNTYSMYINFNLKKRKLIFLRTAALRGKYPAGCATDRKPGGAFC